MRGKAFRGLTPDGVAGATACAVSIKGQVEPSTFAEPVCIPMVSGVSKALRWRRLSAIDGVDRFAEYRSVELGRVPAQLQMLFRFGWPEPKRSAMDVILLAKARSATANVSTRIIGPKINSSTSVSSALNRPAAQACRPGLDLWPG